MPLGMSRRISLKTRRLGWGLAILGLCWSTASFAVTPHWVSRGIGGGGALYSPSISPHDADRVYMTTDMSAVFQSSDFGRGWNTLPFRQLRGGIASDIQFTSDPTVLYAVDLAGDSRIPVKSTDGGLTFNPLVGDPTSEETYYLFADPGSTDRVVLSSYSNLYFSSNGGNSFTNVHSSSDLHLAGAFFDSAGIFVGARNGVLLSTDGGTSFNLQAIAGIPAGEAIVSFAGAREGGTLRFFAITLGAGDVYPLVTGSEMSLFQGLYRLDWDGTPEWVAVDSNLPADTWPFFVKMAGNEADTVYVAGGDVNTSFPVVAKSEDAGATWVPVFKVVNNENIATGWVGYQGDLHWWWPELALGFTVAPLNADKAIITDFGFAHTTEDGGASWHQAYVKRSQENPSGSPTPTALAYSAVGVEDTSGWWLTWPGADVVLASLTDIRGMRSADGGDSWVSGPGIGLTENSTYAMVEHPGTGAIYAATSTVHDIYQSTYLTDASIDGGDGRVLMSTTEGTSWTEIEDFGHPVVYLALDPNDGDTLYASVVHSTAGGIYVTHNLSLGAAATWTRLASPPRTEGHPLSIHVLDDGSLAASYSGRRDGGGAFTTSSGIFYSTDGGLNWLDRSHGDMHRWTKDLVIDPNDATQNTWYAAIFSHWGSFPNEVGGLLRTVDRGQNWERISDLYRVESCTVDPSDPNTLYASTEVNGLWVTHDLGVATPSFEEVADFPFSHPVRMFYSPEGNLWVTTFGGGLFEELADIFGDGFESGDTSAWSSSQE